MNDMNVLKDFDVFFYYGQNELDIETQSDVMANIIQPKRSLFYDRNLDSAGIDEYENSVQGVALSINLPYDIVNSLSKRNSYVGDGSDGTRDRRVAVSQREIRIERNNDELDVTVLYIPLANFKQTQNVQFNLGV